MASQVKTSTPNRGLIRAADHLSLELSQSQPLGVKLFSHRFAEDRLIGESVVFVGQASDPETSLVVEFIPSAREGAYDALVCQIERGDKRIYISHFLSSMGESPEVFTNTTGASTETFIVVAVGALTNLGRFRVLSDAMEGLPLVEVPFDWQGAR